MVRKPSGSLRRGWTTGACATAASSAAYEALLTGAFPDPVTITLPRGEAPSFALAREALAPDEAMAAVVKDAGDDPDVTHGCLVIATVRRGAPGSGATFRAGEGVGIVTRPGLELAVGEPAINPAPRRMMRDAAAAIAARHDAAPDIEVEIAIPGGATLAERTTNARLGIKGGLSIIGTTGVVIPYSCASWIHSIHRGIDVARAAGIEHVAACTGSVSERAAQRLLGLPEEALIDMGDFAGGTLKYLRRHPIPRLTIAGGFAKIAKLGMGYLDLHSDRSAIDPAWFAALAADPESAGVIVRAIAGAASAGEILALARAAGLPLADRVAACARETALATLAGGIDVGVAIFDRRGELVGRADG